MKFECDLELFFKFGRMYSYVISVSSDCMEFAFALVWYVAIETILSTIYDTTELSGRTIEMICTDVDEVWNWSLKLLIARRLTLTHRKRSSPLFMLRSKRKKTATWHCVILTPNISSRRDWLQQTTYHVGRRSVYLLPVQWGSEYLKCHLGSSWRDICNDSDFSMLFSF